MGSTTHNCPPHPELLQLDRPAALNTCLAPTYLPVKTTQHLQSIQSPLLHRPISQDWKRELFFSNSYKETIKKIIESQTRFKNKFLTLKDKRLSFK